MVTHHDRKISCRCPSEDLAGERRIGKNLLDIASTAVDDLVSDRVTDSNLCGADDIEHRTPNAGAEIDGEASRNGAAEGIEGGHMALG